MPTIKFRLAFRRPFVSQLELRDYSRRIRVWTGLKDMPVCGVHALLRIRAFKLRA